MCRAPTRTSTASTPAASTISIRQRCSRCTSSTAATGKQPLPSAKDSGPPGPDSDRDQRIFARLPGAGRDPSFGHSGVFKQWQCFTYLGMFVLGARWTPALRRGDERTGNKGVVMGRLLLAPVRRLVAACLLSLVRTGGASADPPIA